MTGTAPQPPSVVGAARDVSQLLISSLPPAFVMLVILNLVFLGLVFWYEHQAQVLRADAVSKILDHCFLNMGAK